MKFVFAILLFVAVCAFAQNGENPKAEEKILVVPTLMPITMTVPFPAISSGAFSDEAFFTAGCGLFAGYVATSMVLGAKGEAPLFYDDHKGVMALVQF